MPVTYTHLPNQGVLLDCQGVVTYLQLMEAGNKAFAESASLSGLKYVLADFREATEFDLSANEIRAIAYRDKQQATSYNALRIAIVANQDLVYGLSRMWQAFLGETKIESQVFRTVADAKTWLNTEEIDP